MAKINQYFSRICLDGINYEIKLVHKKDATYDKNMYDTYKNYVSFVRKIQNIKYKTINWLVK